MIEFIDKTPTAAGTPLNRANLMAIQGFEATTTNFNGDGTITQTNANGHTLKTTFNADGSITQVFTGEKTITLKTRFQGNQIISEVVS